MVPKKLKQSKRRSKENETPLVNESTLCDYPTLMNKMSHRASKRLSKAQRKKEAEANETECQKQYRTLKATIKSKRHVKSKESDFMSALYTDNVTEIDDLHRAVTMLNRTKRVKASPEMFAVAKVTLETMQLCTLDDYILFFACANLLNNCAKDRTINGGYNFKQRIKYALESICYEHKHYPTDVIAQHTDFYTSKDRKGDCVYVRVCGVQFSFHRTMIDIPEDEYGYKQQNWSGIRMQPHAPKFFNYANHLSNLTELSWIRDEETFAPLVLKELQKRAMKATYDSSSPYHEMPNDLNFTRLDSTWKSDKYPDLLYDHSLHIKGNEPETHIDINDPELDEYNDDNVDMFDNFDII